MDIVFFFLFPSAGLCYVLYVGHKLISSCIALAFHTICLHSYFLLSRLGMGGIEFPSIFFLFIYVVAPCVYRAITVRDRVHEQMLFVLQESLPKYLEQWPAALTIWLILRDPRSRELNPLQSLYQPYSLFVPNELYFTWRGELLQVCAACPTLRLNLSSSCVSLGTISQIHSPPGPRRIRHTVCGCTTWNLQLFICKNNLCGVYD
jgi:hypothetical protein